MKKITTTIKTMLLAAIVLVMAQSCIPTTPVGGNPTPIDTSGNTFRVNISSYTISPFGTNSQNKTLSLDGDALLFSTTANIVFAGGSTHDFYINPGSPNSYEYLANTQYYSYATPIEANVRINQNDLDGINKWITLNTTNNQIYFGAGTILPYNILENIIPLSTNRYIVFRKTKASGYQYCWVKIKYEKDSNITNKYTLSVLDGKYQMDSIITGQ